MAPPLAMVYDNINYRSIDSMDKSLSLLCVGLTTVDVVALPLDRQPFDGVRLISSFQMAPAGTAAGAALVAARLGLRVALAGAVGNDAMGRFIVSELKFAGIDTSLLEVRDEPTSSTLIPIDAAGRRMIFHAPGAGPFMQPAPALAAAIDGVQALHYAAVGAPYLKDFGPALLKAARKGGALTTCDLIAPGPTAAAEVKALLPNVDVFMPSAVEARFLTGEEHLERSARVLMNWGARSVVVKNGPDGALALDQDGAVQLVEAVPVAQVVDTTSCGDSFCAGFIAATLRGGSFKAALQYGSATAALVAQGAATLGKLQSHEQVSQLARATFGA
jgi:sugar/nucleoside kinase (ribokinase family)